ncbi:integral membrane protease of the rhomboid family [Stemphylium lycopersici]|uniref:Integral membrane protease of the rhomboid family n=1 Tax=Stemphylium lycopersici TaxID=183478 RepID=A0A364N8A5_STELY|nr:integral membrane protease of the rhomboid family [Stemphylium lycopersici]RAR04712.1 integral membrane protease of the rhomboid family [Stemphylium lycopersici]RAR13271.1 integral membrane protease of the rhomboid family [Stemphylium lycopersici]
MASLLRLSGALRTLRTPSSSKKLTSHFFSPSHTPRQLKLPSLRPYSSYSHNYDTYFRQVKANNAVLYTLMGTNIAIFGYAMYLKQQAILGFHAPLIRFMQRMTLNLTEFRNGDYLSLLTATFTHVSIGHIFSNMFTVYFLGSFLTAAPVITPLRLLTIALGSGLSGSVGYLIQQQYRLSSQGLNARDTGRAMGFSGAVMGISTVAACLAPRAQVAIWGIIPMPLWALVAGYAVYDGYYLNSVDTRIAHAGHLGGLGFGLVYYLARLRGLRI